MTIKGTLHKLLSALPVLFLFLFLFYFEGTCASLALLSAVFLHESGHLAAFLILGESIPRLAFRPLGITLTPRRMLSYGKEAFVAFGGPFLNLVVFLLSSYAKGEFASALSSASLLLAGVHLLPIIPLDGGRISFALWHSFLGEKGVRIATLISFGSLCTALFFFLYFLLFYGIGLAPVFSLLLLFHESGMHEDDF